MGRLIDLKPILDQAQNNIRDARRLTDLAVVEDKSTKHVVLRRACTIPLFGRIYSYLRFKWYGDSAIKNDLSNFCADYQKIADEKFTKLFNGQSSLQSDAKFSRLLDFVDVLKRCIQAADPFQTYSLKSKYQSWFHQKFPAETLNQVKEALRIGDTDSCKQVIDDLRTHFVTLEKVQKLNENTWPELDEVRNLLPSFNLLSRETDLFLNDKNKLGAFKTKLEEAVADMSAADNLEAILKKHQLLIQIAKKIPVSTNFEFSTLHALFIDKVRQLEAMLIIQNDIKADNAVAWEDKSAEKINSHLASQASEMLNIVEQFPATYKLFQDYVCESTYFKYLNSTSEIYNQSEAFCQFFRDFLPTNLDRSLKLLIGAINSYDFADCSKEVKDRINALCKELLPRLPEWKNTPKGELLIKIISRKFCIAEFDKLNLERALKEYEIFKTPEDGNPVDKFYEHLQKCHEILMDKTTTLQDKVNRLSIELTPKCSHEELRQFLVQIEDICEKLPEDKKSLVEEFKKEYDFLFMYKKITENKSKILPRPFFEILASRDLSVAIQNLLKTKICEKERFNHILKTYCQQDGKLSFDRIPAAEKDEFLVQAYRSGLNFPGLSRHHDVEVAFARSTPKVFAKLIDDVLKQLDEDNREVIKAVIAKLTDLKKTTLSGDAPQNVKETKAYLEKQRDFLIRILSLTPPDALKSMKLNCFIDYLMNNTLNWDGCNSCKIHSALHESLTLSMYYRFVNNGVIDDSVETFIDLLKDHSEKAFDLFERLSREEKKSFVSNFSNESWERLMDLQNSDAKDKFIATFMKIQIKNPNNNIDDLSKVLNVITAHINKETLETVYVAFVIECYKRHHKHIHNNRRALKSSTDFFEKLSPKGKDTVLAQRIKHYSSSVEEGMSLAIQIQDEEIKQKSLEEIYKWDKSNDCDIAFATIEKWKSLMSNKEQFDALLTDIIMANVSANRVPKAMALTRYLHAQETKNNMEKILQLASKSVVQQDAPEEHLNP